ncbi:MAG: hypothetical protein KA801_17290 [Syntrophorhabdaceae bacterium]|nr:hypothetical protein [Syntrophorhabdaceae bacterium]
MTKGPPYSVKTDAVFYGPFGKGIPEIIFTSITIIVLRSWHQEEIVEARRLIGQRKRLRA